MHFGRSLVLVSLTLVIAIPAIGLAQEGTSKAIAGGPYDPQQDFIHPSLARWLYYGEVFAYAPAWSGALALTFNFSNPNSATEYDEAIELIGWPGTFFGFLWATRHTEISMGMVDASSWGSLQGAGAGWLVGDMFTSWGRPDGIVNPRFATALAFSIAGHVLGFQDAEHRDLNWGNSEMLAQSGLMGATCGALLFSLPVSSRDVLGSPDGKVPWSRKAIELGTVAGWAAGVYGWHRYAPLNYTSGDAISSWDAFGTSTLSGFAVSYLFTDAPLSYKWSRSIAGVVTAAGAVYSYHFHENRDIGFGPALLVTMGTAAAAGGIGGAVGLVSNSDKAGLLAAAAGGWGGFLLTHALLGTAGKAQARVEGHNDFLSRIQLMPGNVVSLLLAAKTHGSASAPLVSVAF
jgi:hypothetical protein